MRAFLAVDLTQAIKEKISQFSSNISDPACNKVKPENYHITLKFLGDVDRSRVKKLKEKLQAVEHDPFRMEVKGMGVFPNMDHIKVVWVGADGNFEPMVSQINTVTHEVKERDHEFHPHATIARVKSKPKDELKQLIRDNQNKTFGSQQVNKFVLKKSNLNPDGPVYENLEEFELD